MTPFRRNYPFICAIVAFFVLIPIVEAQHSPSPPDPRNRNEVKSMLAKAPKISGNNLRKIHIVLLAGKKDHGLHEHDYPLWQKNWALLRIHALNPLLSRPSRLLNIALLMGFV